MYLKKYVIFIVLIRSSSVKYIVIIFIFFSVTRQNISEKISQKNNIPTKIFHDKISHVNINLKFKPFYKSYIVITILIQ
jgi:hypothetical protein